MRRVFSMVFVVSWFFFSADVFAGSDIGFGYIKGIKIGTGNSDDVKIYLASGFTHDMGGCYGKIFLRPSVLSADKFDRIYAVALAAQLNDRKIRFYSHIDTCDVTFAGLQDNYY